MPRPTTMFLLFSLVTVSRCMAATGSAGVGWVRITGAENSIPPSPAIWDNGTVTIGVNGFVATYTYSGSDSASDTAESVAAGLAAALNNSSSPVTATATDAVVAITAKAIGSASNYSLSVGSATNDPADFIAPSFIATAYSPTLLGGLDGPRNFRMIMYQHVPAPYNIINEDLAFPDITAPQGSGHAILSVDVIYWGQPSQLAAQWGAVEKSYDMTRVDAVNIDEPYTSYFKHLNLFPSPFNFDGDPCAPNDPRLPYIIQAYNLLQSAANTIKQGPAPIRLWINFGMSEIQWMRNGSCAAIPLSPTQTISLNAPYIDVVSADDYYIDFPGQPAACVGQQVGAQPVQCTYDWFLAHPGRFGQQLALVPGTFVQSSGPAADAAEQGLIVEHYLNYATTMNQSCTLPLGGLNVTSLWDGCPVWMVAGFELDANFVDGPNVYLGLAGPAAAPIQALWQAQLSNSIVDPGLPAVPIIAVRQVLQ
jgi:hypothetical protein